MNRVRHALVVGGSGMLAGLSRSLLDISDRVSVLARSAERVRAIAPALEPVICDYNDATAVSDALNVLPPPGLVVAWIHGRAPELRRALASRVTPGGRFVQVLGSAHGDPSHPERLSEMAAAAESLPVTYQAVILGFALDAGRSRWLTHEEISTGVFHAIMADVPRAIVGTVEPWSARP